MYKYSYSSKSSQKLFPQCQHDHIKFGLIFFFSALQLQPSSDSLFRVKIGLVKEVSKLHVVPSEVNSKVIA